MARPGITKQEVFAAANRLVSDNKEPTIDLIRQITQTGSHSTIGMHLRDWRRAQSDTTTLAITEGIPKELVDMMKGLWERVRAEAAVQKNEMAALHQQELQEQHEELKKYKENNRRWQQLMAQWQQEKEKLVNDKMILERGVEALKKEQASMAMTLAAQTEQLVDKQVRIDELHKLHQQTQANLEHFRESTREQRLIEQEQFERQKGEMLQESRGLKEQVSVLRDKLAMVQAEYKVVCEAHAGLKEVHDKVHRQLSDVRGQLSAAEKMQEVLTQENSRLVDAVAKGEEKLKEKTNLYIEGQTEIRLLGRELEVVKGQLVDLEDRNKILAHEKWLLGEEKAQMEGRLREVQGLVPA